MSDTITALQPQTIVIGLNFHIHIVLLFYDDKNMHQNVENVMIALYFMHSNQAFVYCMQ